MTNLHNRLVIVYDKDGNPYKVSNLNAHDMVVHSGYTYKPGKKHTPVDIAPHAGKTASTMEEKKRIQAILNGVGSNPEPEEVEVEDDIDTGEEVTEFPSAVVEVPAPVVEEVVAVEPEPVVEEIVVEPELGVEPPKPRRSRTGRE